MNTHRLYLLFSAAIVSAAIVAAAYIIRPRYVVSIGPGAAIATASDGSIYLFRDGRWIKLSDPVQSSPDQGAK